MNCWSRKVPSVRTSDPGTSCQLTRPFFLRSLILYRMVSGFIFSRLATARAVQALYSCRSSVIVFKILFSRLVMSMCVLYARA